MITIREIAKEAEVSISTVSHVLNTPDGGSKASLETREKVLAVARKHNYAPSILGKALRKGKSYTIGLLGQLGIYDHIAANSLFGASRVFRDAGYGIELTPAMLPPPQTDPLKLPGVLPPVPEPTALTIEHYQANLLEAVKRLLQRGVDGILILEAVSDANREIFTEITRQLPAVKLLYGASGIPSLPSAFIDPVKIATLGGEYLCELGHRKIMLLGSRPEVREGLARYLAAHGAELNDGNVLPLCKSFQDGRDALRLIFREKPETTAIFCYNDTNAAGVLHEALRLGIRIPDQLSVLGVNNLEISEQLYPQLTTIAMPIIEQGEAAAAMLLELISGRKTGDRVLLPQLIKRESCGCPRTHERIEPS